MLRPFFYKLIKLLKFSASWDELPELCLPAVWAAERKTRRDTAVTPAGQLICCCTLPTSPFCSDGTPAHYAFLLVHCSTPRCRPRPSPDPPPPFLLHFPASLPRFRPLPAISSTRVCSDPSPAVACGADTRLTPSIECMIHGFLPVHKRLGGRKRERNGERERKKVKKKKKKPSSCDAHCRPAEGRNSSVVVQDKRKWRRVANERCWLPLGRRRIEPRLFPAGGY